MRKDESNYEDTKFIRMKISNLRGERNGLAGIPDREPGLDRKAISKSLAIEKIRTGNPFGNSPFTRHLLAAGLTENHRTPLRWPKS